MGRATSKGNEAKSKMKHPQRSRPKTMVLLTPPDVALVVNIVYLLISCGSREIKSCCFVAIFVLFYKLIVINNR